MGVVDYGNIAPFLINRGSLALSVPTYALQIQLPSTVGILFFYLKML